MTLKPKRRYYKPYPPLYKSNKAKAERKKKNYGTYWCQCTGDNLCPKLREVVNNIKDGLIRDLTVHNVGITSSESDHTFT